ncbi:2-hydroxyacyl-CoA dehydratase [Oleiagrimonas sp. C23AA]|uniref:2-hydroxyacyl-CoA dehydratase n=1 Tax=Oleiagrimonas sp. C23AA TaxID=2719047 RepID=UPI0014206EBE|nr:2-hydroxyacyl-CoA dehydratase [Oleiagrimonas sp. C23AA]
MSKYDFRQFQNDLAAIDRQAEQSRVGADDGADRLAQAKVEFLALCDRYQLTVADVVAFFPEEEGIQYLQGLIADSINSAKRSR